jgi:hypothetical protein
MTLIGQAHRPRRTVTQPPSARFLRFVSQRRPIADPIPEANQPALE